MPRCVRSLHIRKPPKLARINIHTHTYTYIFFTLDSASAKIEINCAAVRLSDNFSFASHVNVMESRLSCGPESTVLMRCFNTPASMSEK